ncbi:MAG: zf-HC2 domain-containing protein [Gemmatimonadetes bacterium]|nr:zf-HC2 domain-containing protein [Gemmatimonadota bacterium]
MSHEVGHEELMAYLDGELRPDRRDAVAAHVERCAECNREFVIFQRMKEDLNAMTMQEPSGRSLWDGVSRRLTQPAGWLLLTSGLVVLGVWGVWSWATSPETFWRKLAIGAVVIGALLLLLSAILDRFRDLKADPYREIQQ